MYVQDINDGINSNGIYSVLEDNWIKFPKEITNIKQYDFSNEIADWKSIANNVINDGNYDKIINLINKIYMIRSNGLAVDGEYGRGN